MCAGIELLREGRIVRVYFPAPRAALPVLTREGSELLLPWGARGREYDALGLVKWPAGGWARLESVRAGRWDAFDPRPVKIPARGFMEKDAAGASHWFALGPGQYIQGLLARAGEERRVYVVTVGPPQGLAHIHDRWPRIVGAAGGLGEADAGFAPLRTANEHR
ncbi:MAG TPA: hypothetical protein VNK67_14515 [Burkholderiales bacterium]|nr:hypothetical protein [Burkholderiales bacterium]